MAEAAVHGLERISERDGSGQALGKIAADDSVVRESKQIVESGVQLVEVSDDCDTGRARPLRGLNGCRSVVTIEMQQTGVGDPFSTQLRGINVLAGIAVPKDGALTLLVKEDDALPTMAMGDGSAVSLDAKAGKFRTMKRSSGVIAKLSDVTRGQRPRSAGGDGGGHLSAWQSGKTGELQF